MSSKLQTKIINKLNAILKIYPDPSLPLINDTIFFPENDTALQKISYIIKKITNNLSSCSKSCNNRHLRKLAAESDLRGEAAAIGKFLNLNVVVTSINENRPNTTKCIYLESEDSPSILLYHDNSNNWGNSAKLESYTNDSFYIAFALALKNLISPLTPKTAHYSHNIFQPNNESKTALQNQIIINKAIQTAIANKDKGQKFITNLPKNQKAGLIDNYYMALKIAREEVQEKIDENQKPQLTTNQP